MPDLGVVGIVLAALFGLLFGSFLNVAAYRWPRDLSVLKPSRSFCPACEKTIAWYDNIPLLSFLILGGKCRQCKAAISWRYPLVELATACFFAWAVARYGLTFTAFKYALFCFLMIGLAFADLETLILPDEFTIGGLIAGLALSLVVRVPDTIFAFFLRIAGVELSPRLSSFAEAVFGGLVPAFGLWFLGWLFEKLRNKEGLGFGDVKMIAAVGAFLGLRGVLFTVVTGSLLGSVIGLTYIKVTGKDAGSYQLPFGTFLAVAALLAAVLGPSAMSWISAG